MQTGAVSYTISLAPPDITGSWSVSLGFWGRNENSWNLSGTSGKIYDGSGYMVGSYNAQEPTILYGVISGSGQTLYQDDDLLSNTCTQAVNDYNMVSISGSYLGGYMPSVSIGGQPVLTNNFNPTMPFWNKPNDENLLFITENFQADLGFIQTVSGMGFSVAASGSLTGANGMEPSDLESLYGLIIFGSATSSGAYTDGAWNTLNIPMMSLNSHLVCPENLNWYDGGTSYASSADKTGVVFPQQYQTPNYSGYALWGERPVMGWDKLVYAPQSSAANTKYYVDYGWRGPGLATGSLVLFSYAGGNTTIYFQTAKGTQTHLGTGVYAGNISPTNFTGQLQQDYIVQFNDLITSYPKNPNAPFPVSPDPTATNVRMKLSNVLGGTGAAEETWNSMWGLSQVYNHGRVIPQRASYNVDNLYRRTTLTSGLAPTDQFTMYTGEMSTAQGWGGDVFVGDWNSGKLITTWHKGFWTGEMQTGEAVVPYYEVAGPFASQERMVFSVTPTGMDWTGGYDMWNTLTTTGKQLFINAVAGFFID